LLELNAQNFLTKKKNSFWGKTLKGSWIHWVGNEKETREKNPLRGSQWYQDSHHQRNRLGGGKIIAKIEGGKGVKSTLDSWPPKKPISYLYCCPISGCRTCGDRATVLWQKFQNEKYITTAITD
jgi:hypothetical protein